MPYEVLSHTADLKLRVWGRNPEELFSEALLAMMQILKSDLRFKNEDLRMRNIKIQSPDMTALLVDFLNEALTLAQTNHEIYTEVHFKKLTEAELDTELSGFPVEEFEEDIKAVTYHEAEVIKNKKGDYETNLVFDI
ncbi:MAG: archease [Patescibacteria group bacterium]